MIAISATAPRGERASEATPSSSRFTGAESASSEPEKSTSAICIEKLSSSQKPSPQPLTTRGRPAPLQSSASAKVNSVSSAAIENDEGTQRDESRPSASAKETSRLTPALQACERRRARERSRSR